MTEFRPDILQYFANHTIKSKCIYENLDDCWLWTGGKFAQSYASDVSYGGIRPYKNSKKKYQAHRIAYKLFCGELDDKEMLCHKCDTKSCVNPRHLEKGNQTKNLLDYHRRYKPYLLEKLSAE